VTLAAAPRPWRAAWITPLGELLSPPRIAGTAVRLAIQISLVVFLWRGLYSHTSSQSGLDRGQAVTFAAFAVLITRLRGLDRFAGRDTVFQHMQFGTIVYWFLRPLAPWRYYALRALGDQAYGFAWVAVGYTVCRLAGVIDPPASAGAAAACLVSLLLGQAVLYHLTLLTDLMCFWTIQNASTIQMIQFAQNLLSGAYAPLWYFPGWFIALSSFLPFQSTLNTPLSLYVGRIPLSSVPGELGFQVLWVAALGLLTRLIWRLAARRVTAQGG
jgi:ABC-2 type transport system permease protein